MCKRRKEMPIVISFDEISHTDRDNLGKKEKQCLLS